MTLSQKIYHFLQVDNLVCNNCGKKLSPFKGYYKMSMWPQHAFFTLSWLKQLWFGNNQVLRFCLPRGVPTPESSTLPKTVNMDCFAEFTSKGRLGEMQKP